MALNKPRRPSSAIDDKKLDQVVLKARQAREERLGGYREQSLRIHPPICARCGREFTRENMRELTVHHKDHNHDNNPPDGSNWENLCLYCHDHEHQKYEHFSSGMGITQDAPATATFNPFANLGDMLKKAKK
jgi:5-methylcytosine-specific restriction endonuclease McrA